MGITSLFLKEIIKIHDRIIKKSGGHPGIINIGNLDFTISQASVADSLAKKLATLMFGIITRHPFIDGNKRTALMAVKTLLRLNGKKLAASEKDIWMVLHKIATGEMSIKQIAEWLTKNIR